MTGPRPGRVAGVALSVIIVVLLAALPPVTTAADPLQPLDTSSPRATYQSFLEQTDAIEKAAFAYTQDRSFERQSALAREFGKLKRLFDLSSVPPAEQDETTVQSWADLADILLRIDRPDLDAVPEATTIDGTSVPRWTLPDTEIMLVRQGEGNREGDYLFAPETVTRLPEWRQLVEGEPATGMRPGSITDWRSWVATSSGPLIPAALVEALPGAARDPVLGTPLWKVIVGLLGAMLITLMVAAWYRWIGRRGREGSVRSHVLALSTPLLLLLLLDIYRLFMETQVNHSGTFAQFVLLATTIAWFLGLAWAFRGLVRLVVEWVIGTPFIREGSYDSQLVRLISRVISVIGIVGIVLLGASEVGIPALGLLAGLGVGGLAIGLAAQGTVENLIGGLTLYADRPFRVGDFVQLGADLGTVDVIGPRSTRISRLDGTRLSVPNSEVASSKVVNYTRRHNVLFLHKVGVRYETTPEQLELLVARISERMRAHPMVISDANMPRVRVADFGASSIDIEARAYVDTADPSQFMAVQEQVLLTIYRTVEEVGTALAYPSTTAYLTRDRGISGLPPDSATDVPTLSAQPDAG